MAKVKKPKTTRPATSPPGPDRLELRLFAPGMTPMHRAGLGGLACTLDWIRSANGARQLSEKQLPGGPWTGSSPPWRIEADRVTLEFGQSTSAAEYLRRLWKIAFALTEEGLIWLPGQWRKKPNSAILADLQQGLTLTFLQHGKTRTLGSEPVHCEHDPDQRGTPSVVVEYRKCSWYKHQDGWEDLVNPRTGALASGEVAIEGPLNPGAVVRHNAFAGPTKISEPIEGLLPLYFALVGCLALPVNRGVGVLLIPEVEDLTAFIAARRAMSPQTVKQAFAAPGSDAALQLQVRLDAAHCVRTACHVVLLRPTPWASQQKSRVDARHVPAVPDADLKLFSLANALLPARIALRVEAQPAGRGKAKAGRETKVAFRADSAVRPLIADNLARGRPWYEGFARLMTATNPATGKPFRQQVFFERKGLQAMVNETTVLRDDGEALVVQAIHVAVRQRFGQIAGDYADNATGMRNKFKNERERLRLAFAGAKTCAQTRAVLCDLFSRGGPNKPLQEAWRQILPMLDERWQLTRDLALLALASYSGRGASTDDDPDSSES